MFTRNIVTIYANDDVVHSFIKPSFGYFDGNLFVMSEDAYGEPVGKLMTPSEIIETTQITKSDLEKIIKQFKNE